MQKFKFIIFILVLSILITYPTSAKTQSVLIKKIKVIGNTVLSKKVINNIVAQYEGKYLTIKQMYKITSLITNVYRKEGYILSKAYVPQQDITNNVMSL